MSNLNPLAQTARSLRAARGFGGRSRNPRSSSVLAMANEILHRTECVAGHGLSGRLDQNVVTLLGPCDGLRSEILRWLGQAGKDGFHKGVEKGKQCLLASLDACDLPEYPIKPGRDSVFGFRQLGPAVELVLNRSADERAGTPIAPRLDGFRDVIPIFMAQSDADSGPAWGTSALSHENSL